MLVCAAKDGAAPAAAAGEGGEGEAEGEYKMKKKVRVGGFCWFLVPVASFASVLAFPCAPVA